MKTEFKLSEFPNSVFEIESSMWTGKMELFMDKVQIEQSNEKGKPFIISSNDGAIHKAYLKSTMPDFGLSIEVNGSRTLITKKLKWIQLLIGGLPFILLFIGGFIGGALGAGATIINFKMFRQEGTEISKYLKVLGITILSFMCYFIIAYFISKMIN